LDQSCLDTILDRRSILKFKDDDVSSDVLDKVLHAALRASGPGGTLKGGYRGSQPFSIIVVRDRARRAQLNELLCEGRRPCIEKAPVSLVFCVDTHRMNRWCALGGGAPHFKVPPQVLPVAMLLIGHPEERPQLAPTLPLEAVVHREVYSDPSDEELVEYFADKEKYFQDWLSSLPEDSKLKRHIESEGVTTLAQWVSQLTYTESFYKWRDDAVRTNLYLSELE
jgi:hypothetical protein